MAAPRSSASRINALVGALRDLGLQPGDVFPAQAWRRLEIQAFGVVEPTQLRGYRNALVALDIIEQVGGGRGGVKVEGWRIKTLPEPPVLQAS